MKTTPPKKAHTLTHGKTSVIIFAEDEEHARRLLDEAMSQRDEPLALVKQQAREILIGAHARLLRRLTAGESNEERETWPIKAEAAAACLAGTASKAQTDMLAAEVAYTQEKIESLCQKILDKHNAYLRSIGKCAGLKRKMLAGIEKGKSASATRAALKAFEAQARVLVNEGKKQNA